MADDPVVAGELAALLTGAAVSAIESGEEINQCALLMADYAGPTERHRQFKRELV